MTMKHKPRTRKMSDYDESETIDVAEVICNLCSVSNLIKLIIAFAVLMLVFFIYEISYKSNSRAHDATGIKSTNRYQYLKYCEALYKKIKDNPNVHAPPLKTLPMSLIEDYEQIMPIQTYSYQDNSNRSRETILVTRDEMLELQEQFEKSGHVHDKDLAGAGTHNLRHLFNYYNDKTSYTATVLGISETPWLEVLLSSLGASKVIMLDYALKSYEDEKFVGYQINSYLEQSVKNDQYEKIDIAVSYSAIQYAGLGRFGEALAPQGDLEMVHMMHCMLKPGGMLFLGVPIEIERKGYVVFNAGRFYGNNRLKEFFDGWRILGGKKSNDNVHTVYVLQKYE